MADYTVQLQDSQTVSVAVTIGGVTSINQLTDVNISSPQNNEVLKYNSTSSKWENSSDTDTDIYVKVSSNDTTAGYLEDKIVATSNKITLITNNDGANETRGIDVNEANLTLSNIGGSVTDGQVPNTITLDNITQITARSHTSLSDIGSNTHAQIDSHIATISGNPHAVTKTEVGLGNVPNTDCTDADNISDGLTNAIVTLTQETNFETAYTHSQDSTIHLSSIQKTDLTDAGDSALHYHATDRARANHTGTQTASTISDFDTEVSNNTDVAANTTHRSSDGTDHTYIDQDVTTTGTPTFSTIETSGNVGFGSGVNVIERIEAYKSIASQVATRYANLNTGNTSGDGFAVGIASDGTAFISQRENLNIEIYRSGGKIGEFSTNYLDMVGGFKVNGADINTGGTLSNVFYKDTDDMDDITNGTTYVKTENNLTDALKTNYDTAYTHSQDSTIHLSSVQKTDLTDAGDSTLHYHATDRARANHTGTQTASTISDFDTEVSNNTDVAANTTHRSSDGKNHSDVVLNNTHRTTVTGNPHQLSVSDLTDGSNVALLDTANTFTQDLTIKKGNASSLILHNNNAGANYTNLVRFFGLDAVAADEEYARIAAYQTLNATDGDLRFYLNQSGSLNELMRLDGTGLGVGTSSPQEKIHAYGSGNQIVEVESSTTGIAVFKMTNTAGSYGTYTTGGDFRIYDYTALADRATIDSNGDMGLGTSSPQEHFHVSGSGDQRIEVESTTAANAALKMTSTAGSYGWYTLGGDCSLYDYTATANRITVDSTGKVGISHTTPLDRLHVVGTFSVASSNAVTTRLKTEFFSTGAGAGDTIFDIVDPAAGGGDYFFRRDGSTQLFIQLNGDVGVGTTSPATNQKLHIYKGASGQATPGIGGMTIEDDASTGLNILTPSTGTGFILFGDETDNDEGYISYNHATDILAIGTNGSPRISITNAGVATFDSFPITPSAAPTTDYQVANKKYVDDNIGGSSATPYESTVGATGADYTTLGAAITAGKTRILVIDDTTETGNIDLPSDCIIDGIGREAVNINMGTYILSDNTGANSKFHISNVKITYAHTTGVALMTNLEKITMKNVIFDNNSTSASTYAISNTSDKEIYLDNVTFDLPNYANSGLDLSASGLKEKYINNITMTGGGTSCELVMKLTNVNANNIVFDGSFSTSSNGFVTFSETVVNNVQYYGTTSSYIINGSHAVLNNLQGDNGAGDLNLKITSTGAVLNNIYLSEAGSTFELSSTNAQAHNIKVNGNTTISGSKNMISNSFLDGTVTFSGDDNGLSNTLCDSTLTVNSGADRNRVNCCDVIGAVSITGNDTTITGSKVGADAGGGAVTITINSGANRTIVGNTRTDAAISDSGTSSSLSNNVVY